MRALLRADNIVKFMCRLFTNSGSVNLLQPLGLSDPEHRLLLLPSGSMENVT